MSANQNYKPIGGISQYIAQPDEPREYEDMYQAGLKLPSRQRAMMAQMYYQRVHLRQLGLRLAATCEYHILQQVFGQVADIIVEQYEELGFGEDPADDQTNA